MMHIWLYESINASSAVLWKQPPLVRAKGKGEAENNK